jgi:tetratricopeptide (TPR) repeat protein
MACATTASAQLGDQWIRDRHNMCIEKSIYALDQRIAACSDAINSNWYQHRDLAVLYFDRSTLLNEKGDAPAGLADLDAAMKAWPDIVNFVINRAVGYIHEKKFGLAVVDLTHAAQTHSNSFPILANRAVAYMHLRDFDNAAKDSGAALAIKPDSVPALLTHGRIASALGDTATALKDFEYVQQLQPNDAGAYNSSCYTRALVKLDLETRALPDCQKALALDPGDQYILDSRGLVYLLLGRYDDAIADYNAVLAKDAKNPNSLYGRGLAKRQKGDTAGASADIAAAEALLPGISEKFGTPAVYTLKAVSENN